MPSHRTEVRRTSHGYVGSCSCGFTLRPKPTADEARTLINDHWYASTGDPNQIDALEGKGTVADRGKAK